MFRKLTIVFLSLTLCLTTVACGGGESTQSQAQNRGVNAASRQTEARIPDGQYPVQQATYNDVDGEYSLMLLNTPPGTPAAVRTTDLQMARLTNEEVAAGKSSYLKVENGQKVLYITENFKIEYIHNVTENRTDPQTGQQQPVVVRRESSFWAPFAGAVAGQVAGQAISSLLFRPQYYYPPAYQPGGVLRGFGGYGSTYSQAAERYQARYQAPPAAVRNRTAFRSTGRLRSPSYNQPSAVRSIPRDNSRSTGSGFGSSTLRSSGRSTGSRVNRPSSFGSAGRSRAGFGSRRR